jgi:putrescine transport system substrate-binding protein
MNRRPGTAARLVRRALACATIVAASAAFCAPVLAAAPAPREEEKVLNLYNWSDYIGETTVRDFERETGIKVRYDTFDANETLLAKLVAGNTGYDVVVPSAHWAKLELEGGLLTKLDRSRIPNYANIDPWILKQLATADPGNQYLAPWLWSVDTVGINVDKVKAALGELPMPDDIWDLIFKPEYMRRLKSCGVSFLDSGDEVFPVLLLYMGRLPHSNVAADYREAAALLAKVRPYVTLFSSSGYINELASGSLCVAFGWNGDIGIAAARAREAHNGQNITALIPAHGSIISFDTMAIPADAPHPGNAYQWLNFIYRPEVQAGIFNKVFYATAVRAGDRFVRPEILANYAALLDPKVLPKLVPQDAVNNDIRRLRTRLFTSFKTGI